MRIARCSSGSARSTLALHQDHARQVGQRLGQLRVVGAELALAQLDQLLGQRAQRRRGVGIQVVGELRVEPVDAGLRRRPGSGGSALRPARGNAPGRPAFGADTSARALQNAPTRAVACAFRRLQHAVVGDLVQQVVLERVLAACRRRPPRRARRSVGAWPAAAADAAARPGRSRPAPGPRTRGRPRPPAAARGARRAPSASSRACSTPVSVGGTCARSSLSARTRQPSASTTITPSSMSIFTSSSM